MIIENKELNSIYGGGSFTASMLSAISKSITTVLNLGQLVGTSIRRIIKKNYC